MWLNFAKQQNFSYFWDNSCPKLGGKWSDTAMEDLHIQPYMFKPGSEKESDIEKEPESMYTGISVEALPTTGHTCSFILSCLHYDSPNF